MVACVHLLMRIGVDKSWLARLEFPYARLLVLQAWPSCHAVGAQRNGGPPTYRHHWLMGRYRTCEREEDSDCGSRSRWSADAGR